MRTSLLSFLLVFSVQAAVAQRASRRGTISDSTGGVLPGVSIVALNVDQGLKRETQTDRSGSFSIPLLQPGNYVVSAEKEGFAILEVTELILHVGDSRSLQLVLPVAKVRIQIWDAQTKKPLTHFDPQSPDMQFAVFSPNGRAMMLAPVRQDGVHAHVTRRRCRCRVS